MAASFTYSPVNPLTGVAVTFTSTSTGKITNQEWDFNYDGLTFVPDAVGASALRAFSVSGDHRVALRVSDDRGGFQIATETVHVLNRAPKASFSYSPAFPATNEVVTFKSTSTDPDSGIQSQAWDLDNDGAFDDGTGGTAKRSFRAPGHYTVSLRVTDTSGATNATSRTVPIGDRPPIASFVQFPAAAGAGESVTFVSTSTDPDGAIATQAWDLDGDGAFDDATGSVARRSFRSSGDYPIGLRVTDTEGLASVVSARVSIGVFGVRGQSGLPLLSPFPVVRISGTLTARGIRVRRLIVNAPSGATVSVRCQGRRCPMRRSTRKAQVSASGGPLALASRAIRIHRLERRLLRAGIVVRIFVTKTGTIGKYTRFRIRRGRPPARIDRCLVSVLSKPIRCPPL